MVDKAKKKNQKGIYAPHFNQIAHDLALKGLTNAQIAEHLSVSPQTLYEWRIKHPEFKESLQTGKDTYDSELVEKAMLEDALGKEFEEVTLERNQDGEMVETKRNKKWNRNFQAQRMWLLNRNRDRWKDQSEVLVKDADLEARLQAAEKRLKELRDGKASSTGDQRCAEMEAQSGSEAGKPVLPAAAGEQ